MLCSLYSQRLISPPCIYHRWDRSVPVLESVLADYKLSISALANLNSSFFIIVMILF
jgi:hypothetical protein